MKKIIKTDEAPAAIGTYSQAVKKGNIIFLSGQIALNPSLWNWSRELKIRFIKYLRIF